MKLDAIEARLTEKWQNAANQNFAPASTDLRLNAPLFAEILPQVSARLASPKAAEKIAIQIAPGKIVDYLVDVSQRTPEAFNRSAKGEINIAAITKQVRTQHEERPSPFMKIAHNTDE